ncbi:stage IV sporulation protein A [Ethanoligenens sp.]|uniref:stage IV sporulation protein A n=1 Tax=Ethanoligenens sp. TaxID=2099655 RepID=UPI0039E93150
MDSRSIYQDIAQRTDGDIYIGVVGPVRTGKSTFIKRFMETLVIPNIEGSYKHDRAVDELPQSAAGRTIMTTEPKFIPNEAVEITLADNAKFRVRMIDCVGYIVPSALGYIENDNPRMVMTPWFDKEIPFNMAAEIGTRKVITEHSTIGLVITTDGSIGEIPRDEYAEAEERVINELKEIEKPFVILLNSVHPTAEDTQTLRSGMEAKYNVPVLPVNCVELGEAEIRSIIETVLFEFPVKEIGVDLPDWIAALEPDHWLHTSLYSTIHDSAQGISKIREVRGALDGIKENEYVTEVKLASVDLGRGTAGLKVDVQPGLFYKVLGEATGFEITSEGDLIELMQSLAASKKEYDKVKNALDEVKATGYGIVMPTMEEMTLEDPEIVHQSGRYGVRLKASSESIHMLKCRVVSEINPIVGSEKQSEELVDYLLKEFEEDPEKIWDSNIFGKSLQELVTEGLHNKLYHMPADAREKLQETLERIINEGCGGLICIIL